MLSDSDGDDGDDDGDINLCSGFTVPPKGFCIGTSLRVALGWVGDDGWIRSRRTPSFRKGCPPFSSPLVHCEITDHSFLNTEPPGRVSSTFVCYYQFADPLSYD